MTTTVESLLQHARDELGASSGTARLDAEVLLGHVLGVNRAYLFAHPEQAVGDHDSTRFLSMVTQRVASVPVSHLTGEREFWSLNFKVTPEVLTPRPETELLVEQALQKIPADAPSAALDLGTGSGAIAIAIATERPDCQVTATDTDADTLAVAAENEAALCPNRLRLATGSWYEPFIHECFDVIASNPPYIGTSETALTDPELAHEPVHALYSGEDGLDDIRTIVASAPEHLKPGGWLLLEHGFTQGPAITELMHDAGFTEVITVEDLAGHPRVTAGCTNI